MLPWITPLQLLGQSWRSRAIFQSLLWTFAPEKSQRLCKFYKLRPWDHRPRIALQPLCGGACKGCSLGAGLVRPADAKFSWGCTCLNRPGECWCAAHGSVCLPYPNLWGFPSASDCIQQVVQGCAILLSISSWFPPPPCPLPSQAWCKCVPYLFWCYIQFISYPS